MVDVGGTVADTVSVAADAYMDIVPDTGEEWIIHSIKYSASVEISDYDGTNNTEPWHTESGAGAIFQVIECTETDRTRVKNTDTSAQIMSYRGVRRA